MRAGDKKFSIGIFISYTRITQLVKIITYFNLYLFYSESLYRAFIVRIVLLTVMASLEFTYFTLRLLPMISKSVTFRCDIGPLLYECTGHPGQFYAYLGKKNNRREILYKYLG